MEMTKNQYQEYVKELAGRYWNESDYTWEQFNADCDAVKILPFDLSVYSQLSEERQKWINALFNEEDTDRNGNYMLRGFTRNEWQEMQKLELSYGDYSRDGLSFWAYNKADRLIYTYCEGDTTLKIFADDESYQKEYSETLNWYKAEYAS